jgi:hypothetical protein
MSTFATPHGLDEILTRFGDIFEYILSDHTLDPHWQAEQLTRISLPFRMRLSWNESTPVTRMTCHRLLAPLFSMCFEKILNDGLQSQLTSFGGCFSFRRQRTGTKLSTHSWGIAIDLNPEANAQGTHGSMHPGIISVFREAGFVWGGDWLGTVKDPMHFQFCTGY